MGHDYQFGPFQLDVENERLWRGREEIILRPKSFAVLRYLVAHPHQLVTRDEILQAVWQGIVVTDAVLTVCIGEIRQALGDDWHRPQYVETVHRRGIASSALSVACQLQRTQPVPARHER